MILDWTSWYNWYIFSKLNSPSVIKLSSNEILWSVNINNKSHLSVRYSQHMKAAVYKYYLLFWECLKCGWIILWIFFFLKAFHQFLEGGFDGIIDDICLLFVLNFQRLQKMGENKHYTKNKISKYIFLWNHTFPMAPNICCRTAGFENMVFTF